MMKDYPVNEFIKTCIFPFVIQKTDILFDALVDALSKNGRIQMTAFYANHKNLCFYLSAFKRALVPYLSKVKDGKIQATEKDFQSVRDAITDLLYQRMLDMTDNIDQDFIAALGNEKYEKDEAKGFSLAILPSQASIDDYDGSLIFNTCNRLTLCMENVHAIRKQLNLSEGGALAVAWSGKKCQYETAGVLRGNVAMQYPWFEFRGSGEWWFCLPTASTAKNRDDRKRDSCRLFVKHGAVFLPPISLLVEAETYFERKNILKKKSQCEAVAGIIGATAKCSSGTLLIFAPTSIIRRECKRLVKRWNRGMLLKTEIDFADKNKLKEEFLQLTSIDGALLLDFDGKCYAYGVILDGIARGKGNTGRGARFHAASTYMGRKFSRKIRGGMFAVVCSEDGMVDVIC